VIRQWAAALGFLTRLPVGRRIEFGPEEVGKSAAWFPAVGILIGLSYLLVLRLFSPLLPAAIVAMFIVTAEALLTGALHMDGLADTADGFGGGRTRADVLRIMRDHAIGTYGAVALMLALGLKVAAVASLAERHRADGYLILSPMLGRWSAVLLSAALPYARRLEPQASGAAGAVSECIGRREVWIASAMAAAGAIALARWQGVICLAMVMVVSALAGLVFRRRIGGVTGDTLGANLQVCEIAVLLAGLALW
jgi:adenosylcobinamide-GDP ribazoletransferase